MIVCKLLFGVSDNFRSDAGVGEYFKENAVRQIAVNKVYAPYSVFYGVHTAIYFRHHSAPYYPGGLQRGNLGNFQVRY